VLLTNDRPEHHAPAVRLHGDGRHRAKMPPVVGRLVVVAFGAMLLLGATGAAPVRAAAYDRFYANFAGEELMRAMNADRAARGLPVLATDSTLEAIARDRPAICPSNKSLVIRGRARDMAERGYLSHSIKGCTDSSGAFDAFDLLRAEGYGFSRAAEDIATNNYPSSAVSYALGCAVGGTSCHGSTTLPWTVAVAERSFMNSSQHRANLLSTTYTRFGCGAWASSTGYHYFACYFVSSGTGSLDSTHPVFASVSGVGATYARGSTPTFTATAIDGYSLLSDGYAAIDGVHIRNWAWDHAGTTSSISAKAPALARGTHTFTWWVRDASTRAGTFSFRFSVP
jgi:uncharacterized protein YkwD